MFERFTERGRDVLAESGRLAKELRSPAIRRHHLLISLVDSADEGSGSVAAVLDAAQVDRTALRERLRSSLTASEDARDEGSSSVPFTAEAKRALEFSLREALSLGHNYIGREHLLLGILRGADGPLGDVLAETRLSHERAREIIREQSPPSPGRRGRLRRIRGGTRPSDALELAWINALRRAGTDRVATTGDMLVALAEGRGTHFATIAAGKLPAADQLTAAVQALVDSGAPDGSEGAVRVDDKTGAVTVNDPDIAAELKKLAGDNPDPEALREIVRRLRGDAGA
jgi:ATP-dependent Clp protease ATP-binding subunit ClpC